MSKNNSSLGIRNILRIITDKAASVHFLGVLGSGMYPLFCLAENFGIRVTGSDREANEYFGPLVARGKDIFIGTRATLPEGTSLLVYSLAISDGDGEFKLAEEQGIPTVSRAELLGALMCCYENRIGVSGTHGKSTVTAMLATIFEKAMLLPTVVSGAALPCGSPFLCGSLDYLIYEACEYKDSFHKFSPSLALFLNMELDHTDWFSSERELKASFLTAINGAGKAVVNIDDGGIRSLLPAVRTEYITVGTAHEADYRYELISGGQRNISLVLYRLGRALGRIELKLIGSFNAANAAIAAAAAMECCISFDTVRSALCEFTGIGRRLDEVGSFEGRRVYYDYAHHPTEIRAGIKAVREGSEVGVSVVFSPHTYSRTKSLFSGFVDALSYAEQVIITEISGVREEADGSVSAQMLADAVGGKVCTRVENILAELRRGKGDIIVMGAAKNDHILRAVLKG